MVLLSQYLGHAQVETTMIYAHADTLRFKRPMLSARPSPHPMKLVWRTNSAMLELGLTDATVGHYRNEGLAIILNRHYESGTDRFSGEILDQIVAEKRIQYEYGQIGRGSYQNLRKAAYWIQEMHQTGHITFGKGSKRGEKKKLSASKPT